ncbi:MAG TPA: hypothetical protein PKZ84_01880 [Anaerolineae bacterium]|nr:hypothetical protein [Anaerolineae bacterium]HQI83670.1 hypothetical protein [Anaerolineae bacterium]
MHFADRTIAVIAVFFILVMFFAVFWGFAGVPVGATVSVAARWENDVQRLGATSQLSETLLFTHSVYLPFVARTLLPLTETLKSKYVFVERHWYREDSGNCTLGGMTSLPTYFFDPDTGILTIYPSSLTFKLQPEDMGYVGWRFGGGGYYGNYIRRFQQLPFPTDSLTLTAVLDDGTVFLEYMTMTLTLAPGAEWLRRTVSETTTCVFTDTERIINYNFQERDKIVYYNGLIR